MTPVQLSPPYRAKTDEDALFDEEMRAVMATLKPEAITPLPVPAIDLWWRRRCVRRSQAVSLQQLKLLPFPVLATLVMMNLFNEPKGSLSVKRDAAQQAGEAKRVQLDAMARAEPGAVGAGRACQAAGGVHGGGAATDRLAGASE